jgi:serine protease Do
MTVRRAVRARRPRLALAAALAAPAAAQAGGVPAAGPYAFAERAPRTRLERTIDALLPVIVKVHGASGVRGIAPYATGVLVSAEGHVLTLDLVSLQADRTRVVLHDGSTHDAALLPADDRLGARMLKIEAGRPLPFAVPAAGVPLAHGALVVSLGNCFRLAELSEKVSATFGVLVARARTGLRYRLQDVDYDGELLIVDAANNPGHFGGGLFTLDGRWIGLNARVVESRETNTDLWAAIPIGELVPYVERLVRGVGPKPGEDLPPVPLPVEHGIVLFDQAGRQSPPAYVDRVLPGSAAAAAGLRPDDLIARVGEAPVRTCAEFHAAVSRHRPGDSVSITYKRGTAVHRTQLVFREARR